jgi:hypothetical protein
MSLEEAMEVVNLFKPLAFFNLTKNIAAYNQQRLAPGNTLDPHPQEIIYVETIRQSIVHCASPCPIPEAPTLAWFEGLKNHGPGQGDPLFPWLADHADEKAMAWFISQEVAGEAGFDDLVAMTQVKMPTRAKLELARNYWDEMGNGVEKKMHGKLLDEVVAYYKIKPTLETTVPEALVLSNLMTAFAVHRRYAWLSLGALGVIEMTAPGRVGQVEKGLARLGVSKKDRQYFGLHATLDIAHSREWNKEIIQPLSKEPETMRQIAEGAYLRLWAGAQCYARYRGELGVG